METQKKSFWKSKKFLYGLAIIFVVGIVGSALDDSKQKANNTDVTTVNTPEAIQPSVTSQKVSVGEEGFIKVPSPSAILANTEANYKELTKIYLANDTMGIGDFLLSHKGISIPSGTKVLVIESATGIRKVRVLEGEKIGEAGWIAMEWVSKKK